MASSSTKLKSTEPSSRNKERRGGLAEMPPVSMTGGSAPVPPQEKKVPVDPLPAQRHPVSVEITEGSGRGLCFAIQKSWVIIGRVNSAADIAVRDDSISRHHAAIGFKDGAFFVCDLGSTNGTFVGGGQVTQMPLEHGTEIRIGDTVLTFWCD